MGFGIGGSKSKSSSSSRDYGTQLDPAQRKFLEGLWGTGQTAMGTGNTQQYGLSALSAAQGGLGAASTANNYGMNALAQGGQYNQEAANQLGGKAMQGAQRTLGHLQQGGINPQMAMYGRQIGQQFSEQILPALKSQGIAMGGLGGSRQGIAEGLAGARAGQQLQDFGAQLYNQDQDRRLMAAQSGGQLAGQTAAGYEGLANTAGNLATGYNNTSQQYGNIASGAMDMGSFGMGIPWYDLQQQQSLLGGPIVTSLGGTSNSKGKSGSFSVSGG